MNPAPSSAADTAGPHGDGRFTGGSAITLLKVSSRSNPNAVAGAFAGVVREHGRAEVHVVGAGALNQAMKAIAIARNYLAPTGVDLVCIPEFTELEIDGAVRTALRLVVEARPIQPEVSEGADPT